MKITSMLPVAFGACLLAAVLMIPQLSGVSFTPSTVDAASDTSSVYRFYSATYKHHFYTISSEEKEFIIQNDKNWDYEGVAYEAYKTKKEGTAPLYRFYSSNNKGHFYTTSAAESNFLKTNDPNWDYEGIAYYVESAGNPVYRFYSSNYKGHFYTTSAAESEHLKLNDPNWAYEGIAFHTSTAVTLAPSTFCGMDSGLTLSVPPINPLCSEGKTPKHQTGSGPWEWVCTDADNTIVSICKALPTIPVTVLVGVCGTSVDSCTAGTFVKSADSSSQNIWGCIGSGGHDSLALCTIAK